MVDVNFKIVLLINFFLIVFYMVVLNFLIFYVMEILLINIKYLFEVIDSLNY